MISKKQLKKISSKVRSGSETPDDISAIEEFRDSKIGALCFLSSMIADLARIQGFKCVLSGRVKRTKSIIRKLVRTPGSSVSTLVDLVGMRLILHSESEVDRFISEVKKSRSVKAIKDYRGSKETGYRAVHLYLESESGDVELQLRTAPQQLWANESEYFGEQVKEGGGKSDIREYLMELSDICAEIDSGVSDRRGPDCYWGEIRNPIETRLYYLQKDFDEFLPQRDPDRLFVIVFDSLTNQLISEDDFDLYHTDEASSIFRYKTSFLDENRYDVLLLNSTDSTALRITHPIYFPTRAGL